MAVAEQPEDSFVGRLTRLLVLPLVRGLGSLKRALERLVSRRGNVSRSEMIEEELESVISEGRAAGVMDQSDEDLLKSVIEFGDTLVREVMVPRIDMGAFEVGTPLPAVLEAVVRRGHSRWPVYRDSVDHVVGIFHAKDLLRIWQRGGGEAPLEGLLRSVIFVPENQRISVLLRDFKKRRTHMAIVLDEFGGTAGLVTLEDLVEEIIGEVADEFEAGQAEPVRAVEGGWLIDSRASLAVLGERLGIPEEALAARESETVGGLVSELLGRLRAPVTRRARAVGPARRRHRRPAHPEDPRGAGVMKIGALHHDLTRIEADLLVAPLWSGDRPPRGLAGLRGLAPLRLSLAADPRRPAARRRRRDDPGRRAGPAARPAAAAARLRRAGAPVRRRSGRRARGRAAAVAGDLKLSSVAIEIPVTETRAGLRSLVTRSATPSPACCRRTRARCRCSPAARRSASAGARRSATPFRGALRAAADRLPRR